MPASRDIVRPNFRTRHPPVGSMQPQLGTVNRRRERRGSNSPREVVIGRPCIPFRHQLIAATPADLPRHLRVRILDVAEQARASRTGLDARGLAVLRRQQLVIQAVHAQGRAILAEMYDKETADATRILYGGSVTPDSVDELMAQPDIDGALVGGASLDATKFARIINFKA